MNGKGQATHESWLSCADVTFSGVSAVQSQVHSIDSADSDVTALLRQALDWADQTRGRHLEEIRTLQAVLGMMILLNRKALRGAGMIVICCYCGTFLLKPKTGRDERHQSPAATASPLKTSSWCTFGATLRSRVLSCSGH